MENIKFLNKMLDDRYDMQEVIGIGGMAVIYKALDTRLNRYVAIKVLKEEFAADPALYADFTSESQAVAMLSHPNIVAVYDVSSSEQANYIVMELIEGITLKQYINRRGALSWKEALHFSSQITKALIHAHSRGIIHRDIKPHNIMILKDSSVKVTDFGIARLISTQNTLTHETLGSVHYISPEQAKGSTVDARTDLYSLGVVMYEMITGRLPFEGDSAVSIAIQHISSIPLMPRELKEDIPAGFEAITMRAMNPNLEQRYQSAEKLYEDLENFRKDPEGKFDYSDLDFHSALDSDSGTGTAYRDNKHISPEREGVIPVSRRGDLSRQDYRRSRSRARTVSILTGILLVIVFLIGVFLYLWNYWFDDMFTEPETMLVPRFTGVRLEDVLQNPTYTDYFDIIPTYENSDSVESGYIIRQSPAENRTVIKSDNKADVKVVVSSGSVVIKMPELVNTEYRSAIIALQKLKLDVEETLVTSEDVTEGYVITTVPEAGSELKPGDKVFLTVSSGPEIKYVEVPDVTGDTVQAAAAKLESLNLTVGNITPVQDEAEPGTVIFQSLTPGTTAQEHTKINLNVSSGPDGTEFDPNNPWGDTGSG